MTDDVDRPARPSVGWREPNEADLERAARWLELLVEHSDFPSPDALSRHLKGVEITSCCECGCNSFTLAVPPDATPLVVRRGHGGLLFEASFKEQGSDCSLELLVFTNKAGGVSSIEVDYCGNCFPIPDHIELELTPYHTHAHQELALSA